MDLWLFIRIISWKWSCWVSWWKICVCGGYMYVHVHLHVSTCVWRPEVNVGCFLQTTSMLLVFETRSEPKVCLRWLAGKFLVSWLVWGAIFSVEFGWRSRREGMRLETPTDVLSASLRSTVMKTEPEAICKFERSSPLCAWVLSCKKMLSCDVWRQQASCLLGCWEQRDHIHSLKRASRERTLSATENEKSSD